MGVVMASILQQAQVDGLQMRGSQGNGTCIYIYIFICVYMYIHMYIYTYKYGCVCIYICIFVYVSKYIYMQQSYCNTLIFTATHCNKLQQTSTRPRCTTLQHTATQSHTATYQGDTLGLVPAASIRYRAEHILLQSLCFRAVLSCMHCQGNLLTLTACV